jgi:hypothetical protein
MMNKKTPATSSTDISGNITGVRHIVVYHYVRKWIRVGTRGESDVSQFA